MKTSHAFKPATISAEHHLRVGEYHKSFGGVLTALMRGTPGTPGNPDYYLFTAQGHEGENRKITYGGYGHHVAGATSDIDGLANTIALCDDKEDHPAAQWCRSLVIDGFDDYYMPARHEARAAYLAVPELFTKDLAYLTSTQAAGLHYDAWVQGFANGNQFNVTKDYEGAVRAVRRVLIIR